nr:hypothetical protein [Micromonospora sp. DSM 115978]
MTSDTSPPGRYTDHHLMIIEPDATADALRQVATSQGVAALARRAPSRDD